MKIVSTTAPHPFGLTLCGILVISVISFFERLLFEKQSKLYIVSGSEA